MCKEFLTIAICAPRRLHPCPSLADSFISSQNDDRCAACTSREEEVGDRRTNEELIESPLLTRTAIKSSEQKIKFDEIIKDLWNGKEHCPYHVLSTVREGSNSFPVTSKNLSDMEMDKEEDKDGVEKSLTASSGEDVISDNVSEASSNATHGSNGSLNSNASQESKKKDTIDLGRKVGLQASIWANAPDKSPKGIKHTSSPQVQSPVKRQKAATPKDPRRE
ncbi:hypothetical protein TrVFT333_006236 [Trichoderma virens FT-333]|nr:hypothetical protein TrVFT333_006236 [Trichoderma virens FT-333]